MRRRRTLHGLPFLIVCIAPALAAAPEAATLRLREIYVPYAEFRARAGDPLGVVMTLDEYRKLILDAIQAGKVVAPAELPPLAAAVVAGDYRGTVADGAVRIQARLKIQVAAPGWVRCDLGAPIPGLGRVQLDGGPGWVVIEETAPSTSRAHLLLHGIGTHEAEMTYTLSAPEHDERTVVEGPLVPAAASRIELEVPGLVEARSEPPFLETTAAGDRSRIVVAAGAASSFRVEWRRKHAASEHAAVLRAEHWITYTPGLQSTTFQWNAAIWVARRKLDVLVLREPPGATVVRVDGSLVHAWERTPAGLRILLKEPVLGNVALRLSGVVSTGGDRLTLGPPALADAFANTGYLALRTPRDVRLGVASTSGITEVAGTDLVPPVKAPLSIFAFGAQPASLEVTLAPLATRFESRAAYVLAAGEEGLTLTGSLRVAVLDGRVWSLETSLPPPWRVRSISEAATPEAGVALHGVRHEVIGSGEDTRLRIDLERSLTRQAPLELALSLDGEAFGPDRSWTRREVATRLPQILGAERYRLDLGILAPESMDVLTASAGDWQALGEEEAAAAGLQQAAAALTTLVPQPRLAFSLVKRPARGEYRLVSHVLALEDRLRARVDARLALVDRPIDELVIALPPQAGANAVISGAGLKETSADAASGRRTLRFARPWLGDRQFRIEFEVPLPARTSQAVPNVEFLLPGAGGRLTSERLVVFQSRGPVEIEVAPGPGLMAAEVDETPAFAEPWSGGRTIAAHRFRASGDPGSLRTTVHDRASVLRSLARELRLTTVLSHDGVARTEAEILLAYSRQTHLALRLPDGARSLAVSVNGETARGVRPGARREEIFIALPPLSYATVTVVYEEPDTSITPAAASPLGAFGTWRGQAPILPEMPVLETRWAIHYPEGYVVRPAGGAVRVDRGGTAEDGLFARTFFGRLLAGRAPRLSFLAPERTSRASPLPRALLERLGLDSAAQQAAQAPGQLKAVAQGAGPTVHEAPLVLLWPEGQVVTAGKTGGGATIEISYHRGQLQRFATRTVFLAVLIAGLLWARRRGTPETLAAALLGVFVLTLAPYALDWRSPLVVVPICEGLVALVLCLVVRAPLSLLWRRRASTAAAAVLAAAALVSPPSATAQSPPTDGVLIPYDPGQPGAITGDRVFLPRETFRKLWGLAHPESSPGPTVPVEAAFGTAEYTIAVEGESYRLSFRWRLRAFTDGWNAVPLLLDGKLLRLTVDGAAAGVAQGRAVQETEQVPFIQLRGAGEHVIEGEVTGRVESSLGAYAVRTRLLPLAGATARFDLPAGARLEKPAASREPAPGGNRAVIDLGSASRLEVEWTLPQVEGQSGSRIESRSLTLLVPSPEGYAVDRVERGRVTGRPVAALEYRVLGAWQITDVKGTGVTEWTLSSNAAVPPATTLKVFFGQSVAQIELRIEGRAAAAEGGQVASLALVGASRQETFIGLRNTPLRRFSASSLAGMTRKSREDIASFAVPADVAIDLLYHTYGSGEGETVAVDAVGGEADVTTDLVVFLDSNRAVLAGRSRYNVKGPGPLRHEVALPAGWEPRSVTGAGMQSWEVVDSPRRLSVRLAGRAAGDTEITWTAESVLAALPESLPVPRTPLVDQSGTSTRESMRWAIAASDELDLALAETGRLLPESIDAANTWLGLPARSSYRLALRSPLGDASVPGTAFELRPTRRTSQLSASVLQVVRAGDDAVHTSARIELRIRLGARGRFRIALPAEAVLESIETRNERSREVRSTPEGVEIDLQLQSPVTGEHGVDLVYRVPRTAGALPVLQPLRLFDGTLRLADVDQFVAVLQTNAAVATVASSSLLVPVEAQSLPFLPSGIAVESLQPILRATGLDWRLTLDERLIEVTRSLAVVELAELTTHVGEDGTTRTRAVYTVRNKGLQFLALELPAGSTLWGVTLGGRPIAVGGGEGEGERRIRVPLEHVGSGSLNLEVAVQYEERPIPLPAWRGEAELAAPRVLDTQVAETIWNVVFPDGYTVTRSGGNLREVAGSVLFAKRAENLLGQLDKLSKAAGESDSARVREQAARELSRLEQALGDNIAELETSNRSPNEAAQSARIGVEDLQTQWAQNDATMERARTAQEGLKQSRAEREKQKGAKDAPSREEQAFLEAASHLKRDWRDNDAAPSTGERTPPEPAAAGKPALETLLEPALGARFAVPQAAAPAAVGDSASAPLPGDARGLQPIPELLGAGMAPGVEAPIGKAEGNLFTFTNTGGDARMAFAYQRQDVVPRLAALGSLVLVPVLLAFVMRRRARAA